MCRMCVGWGKLQLAAFSRISKERQQGFLHWHKLWYDALGPATYLLTDADGCGAELKDDVKWDTLDILRDPAVAAQHLDLQ